MGPWRIHQASQKRHHHRNKPSRTGTNRQGWGRKRNAAAMGTGQGTQEWGNAQSIHGIAMVRMEVKQEAELGRAASSVH